MSGVLSMVLATNRYSQTLTPLLQYPRQEIAESVAVVERSILGVKRQLQRSPGKVCLRLQQEPAAPDGLSRHFSVTLLWDGYHDVMSATLKVCCLHYRKISLP